MAGEGEIAGAATFRGHWEPVLATQLSLARDKLLSVADDACLADSGPDLALFSIVAGFTLPDAIAAEFAIEMPPESSVELLVGSLASEPEGHVASPAILGTQSVADASRDLVKIMTLPSGQAQPQERLFAGDALVGILPHLQPADLIKLTRTVARLDQVSAKLRTFLVLNKDAAISGRMLKDAQNVSDEDLLRLVPQASEQQLRLIARRRHVGMIVSNAIVDTGNKTAILDLLRNPQAELSANAFDRLAQICIGNKDLESALCNRADIPQAVGLLLFWQVNRNLRRYLLTRFLTESSALGKVIEIAMAAGALPPLGSQASATDIEDIVSQIETGNPRAAETLSRVCKISPETAARIVDDPGGEPLTVAFKCLAQSRMTMARAIQRWIKSDLCKISGEERLVELHAQFDSMSFNKARMLIAYWDWASREAGPFTDLATN